MLEDSVPPPACGPIIWPPFLFIPKASSFPQSKYKDRNVLGQKVCSFELEHTDVVDVTAQEHVPSVACGCSWMELTMDLITDLNVSLK